MTAIDTRAVRHGPSFASALWITGLALRLVMIMLLYSLTYFQPLTFGVIASIFALDLFVYLFQIVRYSNAAGTFIQETGRFWTALLGWIGFLTAALIMITQWWIAYSEADMAVRPKFNGGGVEVVEAKPRIDRFKASVSRDGRVLSYEGVMSEGMMLKLDPIIKDAGDLQQVTLNSAGGNVYEARDFAKRVAARGLDTHVLQECSSSCLLVYMAGRNRTMGSGAKLGFHRYGLDFTQLMPFANVNKEMGRDRTYLEKRGIEHRFLERYFDPDRRVLWYPNRGDLKKAGVITQ